MDAREKEVMHLDHEVWSAEHAVWKEKIQLWKLEHQAIVETLHELEKLLSDHGKQLAALEQAIEEHEEAEHTSEMLEDAAPGDSALDEFLERAHEEYTNAHEARGELLARIESRHGRIVDLLGALRETALEKP